MKKITIIGLNGQRMNTNYRTARRLLVVGVLMAGLAYASVPFYDWFCRTTGFGGIPLTADSVEVEALDQIITVRFDASVDSGMPWDFKPMQKSIDVKIGESAMAYYVVHNPTNKSTAGSATFNVVPMSAGAYFVKTECFCFQHQELAPGETQEMPVSFYIDPDILNDRETNYLKTITLSYTFYEKDVE